MIGEIGRCVAQRVEFTGPATFRRYGPGEHARAAYAEESLTVDGVYEAVSRVGVPVGEAVAVWEVPPDEMGDEAAVERNLPPVPTMLLTRMADGSLRELNPAYLTIHDRPEGFG